MKGFAHIVEDIDWIVDERSGLVLFEVVGNENVYVVGAEETELAHREQIAEHCLEDFD